MRRDEAKAGCRAAGCRLTAVLLCAALLLTFMPVSVPGVFAASDRMSYAGEGGVVYFNKQTGYITGTDKKITKVDIPDEIEGVAVRGIASWALGYNDSLVSVTLPDSIVDIEKGAFYGAHALREIALPQGVTELPEMAFYECSALKKVSLPAGLETIGKSAFYNCTSLEYVDIPGSVSKIDDLAFYGCSGLKGVYFVEGADVDIGTWAFNECYSLEKAVNVPDARWNKFIDSCKRAEVYMNEQELDDHRQMWRLYDDGEKEAAFTALAREITSGCSGDREKVLAISQWLVKRIRYNTEHFDDPPADNETEVWAVYQGIKALEGTGTPYATTCGGYSNMTQVLCQALGIPAATVWREQKQGETIDHEFNLVYFDGKWRWADNTASDDSKDDSDTQDIDWLDAGRAGFAYSSDHRVDYLLYRRTNKETIYVPIPEDIAITPDAKDWPNQNPEEAYVKGAGYTDADWEYATSVEDKAAEASKVAQRQTDFPTLETSGESLFQFDAATGTITGIHDYTVTEISVPDAINGKEVRAIAERAFSGCRSKVITMPDSITEIGEYAFSGCTALERIRLSGGLKELNSYTFSGCASLKTITIPKSVKRLAGYIFSGCDRLEEILFEDYAMKEACIATDPRGSDDDYAAGVSNISWYAFKDVGRALYGLDFDPTYQRTKWHRALQSVVLTDDWRQNILDVYDSQLDYREGFSPYYVGGTNTREYKTPGQASYWEWGHFSEAGKFHGVDGTTWCYAFTQWAHAMAGIPLTLSSDSYEWKDFTCAGGSYAPQPGDIIGVGASHLAMIGSAGMQDGYMQIQIINGNRPNRNVGKELLRYDPASGKALFIQKDGAWTELGSDDAAEYKIRSLYCPRLSEIVTHTLSLDAGEGTAAWSSRPIAEDAVYGALPEAKRAGYVFDGWYTEKTGGEKALPYRMFQKKADQTLYAHYTAKPDAVVAVHINEENVSVERKATQQITVSFTPENAAGQTVSWRSSNTDVARISAEGVVRGVAAGTAVIEARGADSSDVAYLSVTVTEPSSQSGSGTPTEEPKPKDENLVSYAVEGGNITFDKNTGTITNAEQTITAAEIPASIGGVAVKAIGKEAFYKCSSLSSVSLPEGLETIGQSAFEETALVHVTVPDSVKRLEKWSFCVIKTLEDAVIGSGVAYIGEWAFSQDSALKTVYFKKDWNTIEIETEHKAFTSNPEFKLYDSGSGTNPEKPGDDPAPAPGPVDDGEYIPQDERDISDKAKYKIDGLEWEFSKKSGTITSIPRDWTGGRLPESIDGTPVSYVGDRAGSSRDKILTLVIPEGVKGIDAHAFQACENLEYLGLPASLSHINERAFQYCDQLEDISYAGDWRNLQCGYFAFRGCLFQHPDFSDPYKGSPYYENLKQVKLTGDFVADVMAIAQSQEGYHEGNRFEELDGSNPNGSGEYAEMNYFTGSPDWLWFPGNYEQDTYGGWCGDFCKWAYAMAGAPEEVMDVYAYEHQTGHQWNTSVYAGGTYSLKRGDLIHFDYGHYAMVIEPPVTSSSESGDVLTIQTWNGNPAVEKRTYVVKAADGLLLTVDGKPYGDGSKDYYLAWYCPVNTEAVKDVKSYNVTFDAAGGTVDAAGKTVYDGASYGLLPQAKKDGFTFGGWYTGKSGRGKWITPYRTVRLDEDVTLYAKWIAADEKVWKDPEDSETSMDLVSETGGSVECVYDAATGLVTVGVVPEGEVFVICYDESGRMLSIGAVSGSGGEVNVDGSSQNISSLWLDEGCRPKCGKQRLELAG